MNRIRILGCMRLPLITACVVCAFAMHVAVAQSGATGPPAKSTAKAAAKSTAKPAAKPREGSLGGDTAAGPILTKDELRQCLAEQDRLKRETADVVANQQKLAKDRAEIDRVGAAIDADRSTVDLSNKEAVDAFNARLQAKARLLADYQAAAPAFNQRIDKLDSDDKAFTKNCKGRKYFEDEYDEIKAGR